MKILSSQIITNIKCMNINIFQSVEHFLALMTRNQGQNLMSEINWLIKDLFVSNFIRQ